MRGKALSQCPLPAWGSCPGWQRWASLAGLSPNLHFQGTAGVLSPGVWLRAVQGQPAAPSGAPALFWGLRAPRNSHFRCCRSANTSLLQWQLWGHGPRWHREAVPALGVRPEGSHLAHSWLKDTLASPEEHQGWGQPRFQLFSRPPTPVTNQQHLARATWAEGTAPDREPRGPTAEEKQGEGTHSWQSHHPCTPGTAGAPPHPSLPGLCAQRNSVAQMQPPKKSRLQTPPPFFFSSPLSPAWPWRR